MIRRLLSRDRLANRTADTVREARSKVNVELSAATKALFTVQNQRIVSSSKQDQLKDQLTCIRSKIEAEKTRESIAEDAYIRADISADQLAEAIDDFEARVEEILGD